MMRLGKVVCLLRHLITVSMTSPCIILSFQRNVAGGEVLRQAHDRVEACPCDDGCDKCMSNSRASFLLLIILTRHSRYYLLGRKHSFIKDRRTLDFEGVAEP